MYPPYPERVKLNFFDPELPDTRSDKIASVLEKYSNALAHAKGGKGGTAGAGVSCPATPTRVILKNEDVDDIQKDVLHIALVIATSGRTYTIGEYTPGTYVNLLSQFAANDRGVRDEDAKSLADAVTDTFLGAYEGELRGTVFTRIVRAIAGGSEGVEIEKEVNDSLKMKNVIQQIVYVSINFQLDDMKTESELAKKKASDGDTPAASTATGAASDTATIPTVESTPSEEGVQEEEEGKEEEEGVDLEDLAEKLESQIQELQTDITRLQRETQKDSEPRAESLIAEFVTKTEQLDALNKQLVDINQEIITDV